MTSSVFLVDTDERLLMSIHVAILITAIFATTLVGCSGGMKIADIDGKRSPNRKLVALIQQSNESRSHFTYRLVVCKDNIYGQCQYLDLPRAEGAKYGRDCWVEWSESNTLTAFCSEPNTTTTQTRESVSAGRDTIDVNVIVGPEEQLMKMSERMVYGRLKKEFGH